MSDIYTETTADIVAISPGIYALDYVADTYGADVSIDFKIKDDYHVAFETNEQTHEVITIPPNTKFRVSISAGGTNPVVRLTPLPWHRA